jgi:hypothetical protein
MVAEIKVDLKGIKEVEEVLKEAGSLKPFKLGLKEGAIHLKGKFASYPKVSRRPQPFAGQTDEERDASRRGFFYHLNKGNIEVPYRRGMSPGSKRLGQSWTVQEKSGGLQQVIGTAVSYAKLVQDKEEQTAYHKVTGWKTVQQTIKEETKKVVATINEAIEKAIKRLNR